MNNPKLQNLNYNTITLTNTITLLDIISTYRNVLYFYKCKFISYNTLLKRADPERLQRILFYKKTMNETSSPFLRKNNEILSPYRVQFV